MDDSDKRTAPPEEQAGEALPDTGLEFGTYEVIRNRLTNASGALRGRLAKLNEARKAVFGAIELKLLATEHVFTESSCIARDIVPVGDQFLFAYNVHIGLKSTTSLEDIFAIYKYEERALVAQPLDLIRDERFERDLQEIFKYYKKAVFAKFSVIGPHLFMVFRIGKTATDIKAFKWRMEDNRLVYLDSRSEHEFRFPPQHDFEWKRTHRDMQYHGLHPHVSIEDRVFVETIEGDLTIKIENNTDTGHGVYSEEVEDKDQTLDDAEYFYAIVGNLVLLKILPYREERFRYFIYCEKTREAYRVDSIERSCVLLPEEQGIIFSNGYALQTGEHKLFGNGSLEMVFEKRIAASNGEDYFYVFYNRPRGVYMLLPYNVIEQRVDTPIVCNGYSLFPNGEMIYFKDSAEAQRNHALQIWQTPFVSPDYPLTAQSDSYLYHLGNQDIVRGMADCQAVLNLTAKDDSYTGLYADISRKVGAILDGYHWIGNEEAFNLREDLAAIREAAQAALSEYEKVESVRRNTREQLRLAVVEAKSIQDAVHSSRFEAIGDYVNSLVRLRTARGKVISLRELKYIDLEKVEGLQEEIKGSTERLATRCVEFLLRPEALHPYERAIAEHHAAIEGLDKMADARALGEQLAARASELEMLIEVVSNLKIDDATQRTAIIDDISVIFSRLNQARSELKTTARDLAQSEGIAEFNSQVKLLNQAVANYLDVCDTPEKCEEYLTKVMVQIEELEGRFAEFDEFVLQLTEKREESYSAFESVKLRLLEKRNRRATALMEAAHRILKGIKGRVENLQTIDEIHSYFASDLMIEKVRDIVEALTDLDDTVKVDDIQSRLKTIGEDAVRQLKDRQDLYEDGVNVIRLGEHRFSVNTLDLALTTVLRDGMMHFHLSGTEYYDRVTNPELLETRDLWGQDLVSETSEVYRGEYLAYQIQRALGKDGVPEANGLRQMADADLAGFVQRFMAPRYAEGYIKGVHDHDAAIILRALLEMEATIGLLAFHPRARALATMFWHQFADGEAKALLVAKLRGVGAVRELFPQTRSQRQYSEELARLISDYVRSSGLFSAELVGEAGEYLFEELTRGEGFSFSTTADELCTAFKSHLKKKSFLKKHAASVADIEANPNASFSLHRDWVGAFIETRGDSAELDYVDEAAALLLTEPDRGRRIISAYPFVDLDGLVGDHPLIEGKRYHLNYNAYRAKLAKYQRDIAPRFEAYQRLKKEVVEQEQEALKLDEFRPRVLTSFVRNRLIDKVYLRLVGDNMAKQIGVAGEKKRTDLMGLLLLISPPGYGKTTLMEYIANRLGIIFMKINGPTLGSQVTSLDPAEAPNAAAREELAKLNLAFEMGDNVMVYVDDIQHCSPEFLQKFISLCDAQRKIEGVHKGKTRTYDLRGKKVAVVMAGNPYTESGEKFRIPDMLANRADIYNLGETIGDCVDDFEMSYLENSITSNPVLNALAMRNQSDVYGIIQMAQSDSREGVDLEGSYSLDEINAMVAVMKKLVFARDIVLRVNREYIRSSGVGAEYRTEPPFKLQGSYRNINRIAERVLPIMNQDELEVLILNSYESDAQTLTSGAESNLLKFKELTGILSEEEAKRWADIKRTFARNVQMKGLGDDQAVAQVLLQMTNLNDSLERMRETMSSGVKRMGQAEAKANEIHVVSKVPQSLIGVMSEQFKLMQGWLAPIFKETRDQSEELKRLRKLMDENLERYQVLLDELQDAAGDDHENG
jgi:ATPase involved in DNA repair/ATPase family associated with various cellular activities (AAA)